MMMTMTMTMAMAMTMTMTMVVVMMMMMAMTEFPPTIPKFLIRPSARHTNILSLVPDVLPFVVDSAGFRRHKLRLADEQLWILGVPVVARGDAAAHLPGALISAAVLWWWIYGD